MRGHSLWALLWGIAMGHCYGALLWGTCMVMGTAMGQHVLESACAGRAAALLAPCIISVRGFRHAMGSSRQTHGKVRFPNRFPARSFSCQTKTS